MRVSWVCWLLLWGCGGRDELAVGTHANSAPVAEEELPDSHCDNNAAPGEFWELGAPEGSAVRAASAGQIYVTTSGFTGSVYGMPRDGGEAWLLGSNQPSIRQLTAYNGDVAWTTTGSTSPGGTLVEWHRGKSVTHSDQLYQPMGVAMDHTLLCVADGFQDASSADTGIGKVHCINRKTGHVEVVRDGFARVQDVALNEQHVYFSDPLRGNVHRMQRGSWQAELFATLSQPQFLSLNAEQLYVSSGTTLYSIPLGGGEPRELADVGGDYLQGIRADERGVYVVVTVFGGPNVFRYLSQDGNQFDLSDGQGSVGSVALDSTRLYWSGSENGTDTYLRARCR